VSLFHKPLHPEGKEDEGGKSPDPESP